MLEEICVELHNFFVVRKEAGAFTVSGGRIAPSDFLQPGQYYRITGSTFNDGVHRYPEENLTDETFRGTVWAMAVPPAVLRLAEEIKNYQDTAGRPSNFVSESFGGVYSYQRATDKNGAPLSWQAAYRTRLNQWRKI